MLQRLATRVCVLIGTLFFRSVIELWQTVLRLDPEDKDALQTKLFLLLQTEEYEAALTLIGQDQSTPQGAFKKAYALYRLHRETEAQAILDGIKNSGHEERGALHLQAQLVMSYVLSNPLSFHDADVEISARAIAWVRIRLLLTFTTN